MLCMLAGYWAVGAPLGLYLCEARALGVTGLWIGLAVGAGITAGLTVSRLLVWRRSSRRAGSATDRAHLTLQPEQ